MKSNVRKKMRPAQMARNISALCALLMLAAPGHAMAGPGETVLYSFKGPTDGAYPQGNLAADGSGNLYGVTQYGGSAGGICAGGGCGTIFKLAPDGTESILYSFHGGNDGGLPPAGLSADASGNLYGTTSRFGGTGCGGIGCGTVFKLAPNNTFSVLHSFSGDNDGAIPGGGLSVDKTGNLYGATIYGGPNGQGTLFKLAPGGTETVLYSFCSQVNCRDGANPGGGLIMGPDGSLYGTTAYGGAGGCTGPIFPLGCGTVFKLAPGGAYTVLHSFAGGSDGAEPQAGLIVDGSGNLYGTTAAGGGAGCSGAGCGTVFKVSPTGAETVLYALCNLPNCIDGSGPAAGLLADGTGNLYGTAFSGGASGGGVVFKLTPGGIETVLHSFRGGSDGQFPKFGLIADKSGSLYGVTAYGGGAGQSFCGPTGCGAIYTLPSTPVPFSLFSSSLVIAGSYVELLSNVTLASSGEDINPPTGPVTVEVGAFSVTIPPGAFAKGSVYGEWDFDGTVDGHAVHARLWWKGGKQYLVLAKVTAALTGVSNPVPVTLSLANNAGSQTVTAAIYK